MCIYSNLCKCRSIGPFYTNDFLKLNCHTSFAYTALCPHLEVLVNFGTKTQYSVEIALAMLWYVPISLFNFEIVFVAGSVGILVQWFSNFFTRVPPDNLHAI